MARCLFNLVAGAAVAYAACDGDNCEADLSELMQVDLKNSREKRKHAEAMAMTNLIEKAFEHIKGAGTHFDPTASSVIDTAFDHVTADGGYLKDNIKADATWKECTKLDWTKIASFEDEQGKLSGEHVEKMMKELHLEQCMGEDGEWGKDPTCEAVRAALKVSTDLSHEAFEPRYHNFSVVAWGENPSWVQGTVVDLDYSKPMPVKAKVKDPKGVIGYAICDALRVILTQSADQMSTGTCSYVASLAALSHKAPAKLIKLGVRLFWTGMITPEVGPACDGIYEQQPGLIPFQSGGGWIPALYSNGRKGGCAGSEMDCEASEGRPQQNAGLTWSWTQSLISTWMKQNFGYCQKDGVRSGLTYPGQSREEMETATQNQGGWFNSMFWECANFIDPKGKSCQLQVNAGTCSLKDPQLCRTKLSLEPASEVQSEVWEPALLNLRSEAYYSGHTSKHSQEKYVIPKLQSQFADNQILLKYTNFLADTAKETGENFFDLNDIAGPPFPSFSKELLKTTCNAYTNLLVIDATVLQVAFSNPEIIASAKSHGIPLFGHFGLPPVSYGCNHAVYLQSCDFEKNAFVIWTWGTSVTLTEEILLGVPAKQPYWPTPKGSHVWNTGAICASVTADQITVE